MAYLAWRTVSLFARILPLPVAYFAAGLAGSAAHYAWPRGRANTAANFARVLGPDASTAVRRRTARRSLGNYCRYVVDLARLEGAGAMAALHLVEDSSIYLRLRPYVTSRRGVIVTSFHQGNWDAGAAGCAAAGLPVAAVIETFADARLDAAMHGLRAELGIVPVRMEQMGPSVVRTLREGGILALLIDRPVARGGVPVRLFGADTAIPRGPAALALMTGAKVVPVAFVRSKPNRAPVRLLADFSIETPAERTREAERRLTQRIVEAHEGFVRECPEQWYMFRRFWPEQEGAALTPVPSPDFAGEGR